MNPTRDQIDQLRRQANELSQSDSPAQRAWAQELFRQADDLDAATNPRQPEPQAHVEAYRAELERIGKERFMATASPRLIAAHRAIERETGGTVTYAHLAH